MRVLIISIFLLSPIMFFSQSLIYPKIPTDYIKDLHFINENEIIFINEYGSIYKSFDGGKSWERIVSFPYKSLTKIIFINETTGFIRINNHLLYTTDSGNNWEEQNITLDGTAYLPISEQLIFKSSETGDIFSLNNFFNKWTQIFTQPMFYDSVYYNTYFPYGHFIQFEKLLSGKILALGNNDIAYDYTILDDSLSVIIETNNFGASWDTLFLDLHDYLEKISFINDSIGWSKSHRAVYKSVDGGKNWSTQDISDYTIDDIATTADSTIFVLTGQSKFFVSENFGESWALKELGYSGKNQIEFYNKNKGFHFGNNLVKTENGGNSWDLIDSSYKSDIFDIDFLTLEIGFALGSKGLYKTETGGNKWEKVFSPEITNPQEVLQIKMLNAKKGWLITWEKLYRTIDGGETWIEVYLEEYAQRFKGFEFYDEYLGIIFNGTGRNYQEHPEEYHYITTNGGDTWNHISPQLDSLSGLPITFEKMQFTNPKHLWGKADNGLWVSNDTSKSWEHILDINFYNGCFNFYNSQVGIVSNHSREFQFTNDGGVSWKTVPKISFIRTLDCKFIGPSMQGWNRYIEVGENGKAHVYYINQDGSIRYSYEQFTSTSNNYNRLYVLTENDRPNVWAAGNGFSILYRKWELITDLNQEEIKPLDYSLGQNYPNPFNLITNILFSIKKPGLTSITIYNLLGERITTLFNEFKNIGSYKVSFDASFLSSGVYIYQIKSDIFTQSKKMILIK
ncbi:MAG: T9SS C-terminal target domain-containing protein [Calditrichaeota bacterium]|nr:MAG: T9SS C-terminal target domain-containing protein [Calditrichota bacterium]MBL1203937.1 T9SS C-terminal target domain-containing protein [Calditrichota bacterium]NOG43769.1 T9SS type A sorting domain-containing protein [Calditrichota bacterium]